MENFFPPAYDYTKDSDQMIDSIKLFDSEIVGNSQRFKQTKIMTKK